MGDAHGEGAEEDALAEAAGVSCADAIASRRLICRR